jgi:hypothetical protein
MSWSILESTIFASPRFSTSLSTSSSSSSFFHFRWWCILHLPLNHFLHFIKSFIRLLPIPFINLRQLKQRLGSLLLALLINRPVSKYPTDGGSQSRFNIQHSHIPSDVNHVTRHGHHIFFLLFSWLIWILSFFLLFFFFLFALFGVFCILSGFDRQLLFFLFFCFLQNFCLFVCAVQRKGNSFLLTKFGSHFLSSCFHRFNSS